MSSSACRSPRSATLVEVRLRGSTIAFAPAPPGDSPRYQYAVNVRRSRAGDALAWLRGRVAPLSLDGGRIVRFEFIATDAVHFLDGGGNVVELIARDALAARALSKPGPWPTAATGRRRGYAAPGEVAATSPWYARPTA